MHNSNAQKLKCHSGIFPPISHGILWLGIGDLYDLCVAYSTSMACRIHNRLIKFFVIFSLSCLNLSVKEMPKVLNLQLIFCIISQWSFVAFWVGISVPLYNLNFKSPHQQFFFCFDCYNWETLIFSADCTECISWLFISVVPLYNLNFLSWYQQKYLLRLLQPGHMGLLCRLHSIYILVICYL